jgi:riboflavin biosynthesis pyrimidine reductase
MGRILLQMMISLDGMVSGPKGELDWIANDEKLQREHLARLEEAELVMLGAGACSEMSGFWKAAEDDEKADPMTRELGRAMNAVRKVVYSHKDRPVDWRNAGVHAVKDDGAFVDDVRRLKQETDGIIVTYGGVRFARSLLQQGLVDEIHLDVCPIVLGMGQALFTGSKHRTKLRLRDSATYDSGTTLLRYDAVNAS